MAVWKSITTEEEGNIPETEDKEFDNQTSSANNNNLKSSEDYDRGEYSDDADSAHILVGDKEFFVGQKLDVLDSVQRWTEAEVGIHIYSKLFNLRNIILVCFDF